MTKDKFCDHGFSLHVYSKPLPIPNCSTPLVSLSLWLCCLDKSEGCNWLSWWRQVCYVSCRKSWLISRQRKLFAVYYLTWLMVYAPQRDPAHQWMPTSQRRNSSPGVILGWVDTRNWLYWKSKYAVNFPEKKQVSSFLGTEWAPILPQ